jgi:hypothetical protein
MRIGVVDLDTSHPAHWIPLERELGHEVVGVWDGGSVHPPEVIRAFATQHAIPRVYETLELMADDVDCAVIHGCDWDTHVAKARPFVEAGRAVLLDKPLAGNVRDLRQFCRWAETGARIAGGSSLRFCFETQQFLKRPAAERGEPHTVLCGCAVDDFNYGIHAYAHLSGILGSGAVSVQHLGTGGQRRVRIDWADGRMGLLVIGAAAAWLPFYTTIVTPQAATQVTVDAGTLYRALLETVLPYLSGATDLPPVPLCAWVEPELCALAAQVSWRNGDRPVRLADLPEAAGYDGRAFAAEYRAQKYPQTKG